MLDVPDLVRQAANQAAIAQRRQKRISQNENVALKRRKEVTICRGSVEVQNDVNCILPSYGFVLNFPLQTSYYTMVIKGKDKHETILVDLPVGGGYAACV